VDTGAWGLMLPRAWKEQLGSFPVVRTVEMVTADHRVVTGEVCGPATIRIEGFEPVSSEVTFVDMELESGRYDPLLGYTVLEQAGIAVDPVGHRLLKIPHMDLRAASRASA
jgi:predicted aspartyl protease